VIYALPAYGAKKLTVVVPWYPTGTMERIDEIGQVPTGASLAKMLSATPLAATGPVLFVILDIHALSVIGWRGCTPWRRCCSRPGRRGRFRRVVGWQRAACAWRAILISL
jgi:hypothetical protein